MEYDSRCLSNPYRESLFEVRDETSITDRPLWLLLRATVTSTGFGLCDLLHWHPIWCTGWPVGSGYLQVEFGFHYGFGTAAVGMAIGLVTYFLGRNTFSVVARVVRDFGRQAEGGWLRHCRVRRQCGAREDQNNVD